MAETTAEGTQPQEKLVPVKVDSINEATYKLYIDVTPRGSDALSFSDWAAREQVRLLRGINGKLTFFVVFMVLSIIFALIQAIMP